MGLIVMSERDLQRIEVLSEVQSRLPAKRQSTATPIRNTGTRAN